MSKPYVSHDCSKGFTIVKLEPEHIPESEIVPTPIPANIEKSEVQPAPKEDKKIKEVDSSKEVKRRFTLYNNGSSQPRIISSSKKK